MPDISRIGNGASREQEIQQPRATQAARAPAELQRAKPSILARIGRVLAAVFTIGISEIVRRARAGKAPAARAPQPGIPAAEPRADMSKRELIRLLDRREALPPAFQGAMNDAVSVLRELYGEKLVPKGAAVRDLPRAAFLMDAVISAVRAAPDEVQPGHLLAIITESAAEYLSEQVFTEKIGEWCRALGLDESKVAAMRDELLQKQPQFAQRLHASGTRSAAEAKIEEFRPFAESYLKAASANEPLLRGLDAGTLPGEFAQAVEEGLSDLRALYGEEFVPQGATLGSMPGGAGLKRALAAAVRAATDRGEIILAGHVRSLLGEKGVGLMAEQLLERRIAGLCEETGFAAASPGYVCGWLMQGNREIASRIRSCATLADARAAVAGMEGFLAQHIALRQELAAAKGPALQSAAAVISQKTGLSEEAVREKLNAGKLETALGRLESDFLNGTLSAENGGIAREFGAAVEKFAEKKASVFNSVDALPLPGCLKEAWKTDALAQEIEGADVLPVYCEAGRSVDAAPLLAMLGEPAAEGRDRRTVDLMSQLVQDARTALVRGLGGARWEEIGGPGQAEARFYAVQAMLGAVPGLLEALASDPEQVSRLQELASADAVGTFENNEATGLEDSAQASLRQSNAETVASVLALLSEIPVRPSEAAAA